MSITKTIWPKLIDGHTYRFEFHSPDGELLHCGTWTVHESSDSYRPNTAGAFRAYVMRWTKPGPHGKNVAVITEVSEASR